MHELLGVDLRFGYMGVRNAVLEAGRRLDHEPTTAHGPDLPPRPGDPPPTLTLAFDGGYARQTRKGAHRNFEILSPEPVNKEVKSRYSPRRSRGP